MVQCGQSLDGQAISMRFISRNLKITILASLFAFSAYNCASRRYTSKTEFGLPQLNETFENPTRITIGNESNFSPTLSPNGSFMFYTSDRNGNKDIFVKKTRGGYGTPITSHPADDFSPVMSPNGKYIAFVSRRTNAAGAIHIMEMGANISNLGGIIEPTLIDINLRELENRNPAWFPNSKKIVFSAREMGNKEPRLYLANVDKEAKISSLAEIRGDYPSVSPDGTKIVYSRGGRLYLYNLTNSQEHPLTDGIMGQDGHPNFSSDNDTVTFIRYADDTNSDGHLTPEDRPTIWSLRTSVQVGRTTSLESFKIAPLSSSSRSAFYPRSFSPYIYFASEDSDSLDIYRLPDFGHVKNQTSLVAISETFEKVNDDDDKLFVLRRGAALAAQNNDQKLAGELALKELAWLTELGRRIEASNLRKKIADEFRDNQDLQSIADLQMLSLKISPYRFPDPELPQPDDFSTRLNEWERIAKSIKGRKSQTPSITEQIRIKADIVLSEIAATKGNFRLAETTLRSIAEESSHHQYDAAKALAYLVRIEAARRRLQEATAVLLELERKFLGEKTTLHYAAIDLMDAIKPNDPEAISKLNDILERCRGSVTLRGYTRKRLGEVMVLTDKADAASSEYRLLLKEAEAPPHIYLEAARSLIKREESNGRISIVLAVFDDLREAIKKSTSSDRSEAAQMESEFYVRRGRILLNEGESALARRAFEKSTEINPGNISAQEGLIDVAEVLDELSATIKFRRTLSDEAPRDPVRLYLLAYALQKQKRITSSIRAKAISEAIEILENARQINGQVPQFHKLLGKLYLEKAHSSQAANMDKSFTGRLASPWTNTKSFFGFSDPNWFELSIDSSLTAYYLADEESADKAELSLQLANSYFENQTFTLSLRHYLRRISMLQLRPFADQRSEMRLFRHAGRSAFFADELKVAETMQKRSLQLAISSGSDIDKAYAIDALALTLREQGKVEEARIAYSKLLEIQSKLGNKANLVTTRINIAYCFMMAGKREQALEQYAKAESLLAEIKTEDNLKTSDGILIDIAGENSAARGFTSLDQKIQIASFRAQIREGQGDLKKAQEELIQKIALLNEKRKRGKKFGFGDSYLSEDLSVSHNNLGYLLANMGQLPEAMKHFSEGLGYAQTLRSKGQEFPSRSEWINLLDLARTQLRRADLKTLPRDEQAQIEKQLTQALNELSKPVASGNRDASLAAAALNSVLAQILSSDNFTTDERRSMAQSKFQESILLAQKLGLELPFVNSANLNLDREEAAKNPNRQEILSSHIEFRRSAVSRPGLAWKYLATRGLCTQAIEALYSHVGSGGKILENDATLMRTCMETQLAKNDADADAKLRLLRQYFSIMSRLIIQGGEGESQNQIKSQVSELFRIGKAERIGAALNASEVMVTLYKGDDGAVTLSFISPMGEEGIRTVAPDSETKSVNQNSISKILNERVGNKNIDRLYVVTDNTLIFEQILRWSKLRPKLTISFIPSPDFLPNIIGNRPLHFDAELISENDAGSQFFRGFLQGVATGKTRPLVIAKKIENNGNTSLRVQFYESPLEDVSQDLFDQALIIGYPGVNAKVANEQSSKYFQRAMAESETSKRSGDPELAYLRARESFYYAWLSGNKEELYKASNLAYHTALEQNNKTDLVYFLNAQRHFSEELKKDQSTLKDIEAAEIQQKGGRFDDAERILARVLSSKHANTLKPDDLARVHDLQGIIHQQRRRFDEAIKSLLTAKGYYQKAKDWGKVAICNLRLAKINAYELFDFAEAKKLLSEADKIGLVQNSQSVRLEIRLVTARILIQSHEETNAQNLLIALLKEDSSRLAATELAEVHNALAESLYWQSRLSEAKFHLNEAAKQISRVKAEQSSVSLKLRTNNLRAMILAAEGKRSESLALFNSSILQAIETKQKIVERDLRHNLAHWHRQWGEFSKAAALFESAITINEELAKIDPQNVPFSITETANLALVIAMSGDPKSAKILLDNSLSKPVIKGIRYAYIFTLLVEADILGILGQTEEAEKKLSVALDVAGRFQILNLKWRAQYGLGISALKQKRFNTSLEFLKQSYDYISKMSVGVLKAEFSSNSIAQASYLDVHERYIEALLSSDLKNQAFETSLDFELKLKEYNVGKSSSEGAEKFISMANQLSKDGLIVAYFFGEKFSHIFRLVNGKLDYRKLNLRRSELEKTLTDLSLGDKQIRERSLNQLAESLLRPIQSDILRSDRLRIISTRTTSAIPFAGLQLSGKYLVQSVEISYLPIGHIIPQQENIDFADKRLLKVLGVLTPQDKKSFLSKERTLLPRFFPDSQILYDEGMSKNKVQAALGGKNLLHISAKYETNTVEPKLSEIQLNSKQTKTGAIRIDELLIGNDSIKLAYFSQPTDSDTLAEALFERGIRDFIGSDAPKNQSDTLFVTKNFYRFLQQKGDPCLALRQAQIQTIKFMPESTSWSYMKIYSTCGRNPGEKPTEESSPKP